jgi:hypothetical protein
VVTSPVQGTIRFHQVSQGKIRVHGVTSPAQDIVCFHQVSQGKIRVHGVTSSAQDIVCVHQVSQGKIRVHRVTSHSQDTVCFHQVSQDKIRASATNRVAVPARLAVNKFLGSLKSLQIRALVINWTSTYQCTADFENLGDYFLFLGKLCYGPFLGIF